MKKIILMSVCSFFILIGTVFASPFLVSDPNDSADPINGIYRLEIDGILGAFAPVESDGSIRVDVQSWEGSKIIRVQIGNPWPGLPGQYKWSEFSDPFVYAFPGEPGKPMNLIIVP